MSTKSFIIGAQLETINEELERREAIFKKIDTASSNQPVRIGGAYFHKRDLLNQIEELRAQKKALEEQMTELMVLDQTVSKVPKSKYVKLGSKRL